MIDNEGYLSFVVVLPQPFPLQPPNQLVKFLLFDSPFTNRSTSTEDEKSILSRPSCLFFLFLPPHNVFWVFPGLVYLFLPPRRSFSLSLPLCRPSANTAQRTLFLIVRGCLLLIRHLPFSFFFPLLLLFGPLNQVPDYCFGILRCRLFGLAGPPSVSFIAPSVLAWRQTASFFLFQCKASGGFSSSRRAVKRSIFRSPTP